MYVVIFSDEYAIYARAAKSMIQAGYGLMNRGCYNSDDNMQRIRKLPSSLSVLHIQSFLTLSVLHIQLFLTRGLSLLPCMNESAVSMKKNTMAKTIERERMKKHNKPRLPSSKNAELLKQTVLSQMAAFYRCSPRIRVG